MHITVPFFGGKDGWWGLIYSECHTRYRPTLIGSYIIPENALVKILNIKKLSSLVSTTTQRDGS
jgi:hypothetical protein